MCLTERRLRPRRLVEAGRPSLMPARSTENARNVRLLTTERKITIAINRPAAASALTHSGHLVLIASAPHAAASQTGAVQRYPRGNITEGPATGTERPSTGLLLNCQRASEIVHPA